MVSFGSHVDFSIPHIKIRNLNKHYAVQGNRVHALKNIDLDIPTGKVFGIIGKSGAGKSSLLRTLNGLERISEGHIHIHQQDLATLSHTELIQLRQRIGMIFQHFNLMSAKTVYENVALPLKVANYPKQDIEQRVNEVLQLVGLSDKAQHYPSQLSGGQKQMLLLARLLIRQPNIVLLDEPTAALDEVSEKQLLDRLKLWLGHRTLVVATHRMAVLNLVDRIIVVNDGQVVMDGTKEQVLASSKAKAS